MLDDAENRGLDSAHLAGVLAAATEYSIIATDLDGLITTFNHGAERMLGYRAQDVVGRLTPAVFHDPDEVAARAAQLGIAPGFEVFVRAARTGSAEARDWTYVRRDGARVPVSLTVTAIEGDDGPAGFIGIARDVSVEREAAAALRHTAERMRAVFNASPVPTALTRLADESIMLANPACLELLGWEEEEFVGRTMLEVGLWARPERHSRMLDTLRTGEDIRGLEEEIRTKRGEVRTVLASKSVVELDGEQCFVVQIFDVTASRRMAAELRESTDRFRQVTETLKQAFWLRNVDPPEVLYASPAVERIFGIDRQAFISNPLALVDLLHPEDRARALEARDAMTRPTDFEYRIIRCDGETRWIRTRLEPVLMKDGAATRIAAVSEDVTDEHALREALRESEEGFRLLAENSTDVIMRASLDTVIQYISPACRTVYGYEPEEMIGMRAWDLVHPADLAQLRAELASRPDQPPDTTNDFRIQRKDGTYIWVEERTHALRDPQVGEQIASHISVRDISERKEAEAAIRRARDEAEAANHAKSDFLSRMSHELRTPLHAILGFGKLLSEEDLGPGQLEQLDQIVKGGRHLLELVDEVLDITRIERGERRLSREPVHLGLVVAETLEMIAPLAAARAVTIEAPRPADVDVHVHGDRQRLKQVMLNLLSNAVKYNREGGHVAVGATSGDASGCRITVADTGPGIAPEDLGRVFEAFERLGAETSEIEGTGLGLALVDRLMRSMGGAVGVESEVGEGATFWLELAVVAAPRPTGDQEPRIAAVRPRGPARTVLYVEDNPSNIKLVERILARRPEISLLIATQGGLALELAREHRPALVLLDLNLPDMSGEEVLARLRDDPRTAALAVVVLSADATPGQMARLRLAGADDYLTKPFEIEQLLAVVDGAAARDEVAAPEPPATGVLDHDRLRKLRLLYAEAEPWDEFLEVFREDAQMRLQQLAAAARSGDTEAVWQAAHGLTGSCNLVGAARVLGLLDDIGTRAREGAAPDDARIAALHEVYAEADAALRAEPEEPM